MITVKQLKELLEGVDGDVPIVVRTDYYYEYATDAAYEENFTDEGPDMAGRAFIIQG